MEGGNSLLTINKIYKSFGHVQALAGASFTVPEGQVTAIVGDNGSGKSTIAKIISGCLKPDAGELSSTAENIHLLHRPPWPYAGISGFPQP